MKSKFQGLPKIAGKKSVARDEPPRGRPKGTSPDSAPVTFHLSAETYRQARIKLLTDADTRPLSKVVELLLDGWHSGRFNV